MAECVPPAERIAGLVERVTFHNEQNGLLRTLRRRLKRLCTQPEGRRAGHGTAAQVLRQATAQGQRDQERGSHSAFTAGARSVKPPSCNTATREGQASGQGGQTLAAGEVVRHEPMKATFNGCHPY